MNVTFPPPLLLTRPIQYGPPRSTEKSRKPGQVIGLHACLGRDVYKEHGSSCIVAGTNRDRRNRVRSGNLGLQFEISLHSSPQKIPCQTRCQDVMGRKKSR